MPYKYRVTKKCSECGNVLESVADFFCDGCGLKLENQEEYDKQIHIGRLSEVGSDEHFSDLLFHNFDCFLKNAHKIVVKDVRNVSINFMGVPLFAELVKKLTVSCNTGEGAKSQKEPET